MYIFVYSFNFLGCSCFSLVKFFAPFAVQERWQVDVNLCRVTRCWCLSSVKLQMLLWSKSVTLGQCTLQEGIIFVPETNYYAYKKYPLWSCKWLGMRVSRRIPCLNWTSEARMLLLVQTSRLSSRHPFTHASMQGLRPELPHTV